MQFHPQWSQWGLFSEEHSGLLGSSHVSENHEEPAVCCAASSKSKAPAEASSATGHFTSSDCAIQSFLERG